MSDGVVKILEGNTFVVSDERGDIEASRTDPTGLFSFDTRFLSKWVLSIDGERLNALSTDDLQYYEAHFFLVPGTGTVYIDAKLSVIRRRSVGVGFIEDVTILNHDDKPVEISVSHRRRVRLRRFVRSEGRAREEGQVLLADRRRLPPARLRARYVSAGDADHHFGIGARRRHRLHFRRHDRAARSVVDRLRRRHRHERLDCGPPGEHRRGTATNAPTWNAAWRSGSPTRPDSNATPIR